MIQLLSALWIAMTITLDLAITYEFYKAQCYFKKRYLKSKNLMFTKIFLFANFIFLIPICLLLAPYGIYKFTFMSKIMKMKIFLLFEKTLKEYDD